MFLPALTCLTAIFVADGSLARLPAPDPTTSGSQPATVSADFARDIVPALTKAGCNSGACHGSFQGRGGFQLSLLGFDPAFDLESLTRRGRGRRIQLAAPDQSLLLRKPTGELPHAGGKRFDVDSAAYGVLRHWIARGAPGGEESATPTISLDVTALRLAVGGRHALQVQADWHSTTKVTEGHAGASNSSRRDVTSWCLYDSRDPAVAEVTRTGQIVAKGAGKTAITVRYAGQIATVGVTVPWGPPAPIDDFPIHNFIDELALAEWKKLGVHPAPLVTDEVFLRRVYLDLIGTLPSPDEVREFLSSRAPTKRVDLIDQLLERPEYVEYWTLRWCDLLRVHRRNLGDKGLAAFSGWIRRAIRENRRLDDMAREILTAQGNLFATSPVGYFFIDEKLEDLTETTAQIFLGVRLQCARCHHHPQEVWSQDDYYGLAAFFRNLETKDSGQIGARFGGIKSLRPIAQPNPGRSVGRVVPPRALGSETVADARDIRAGFANWLTAPENPYFAKNFVNRYWAALLGQGLVEPVDDLRGTNPPIMPELFERLSQDFRDHRFDAKHLLRTICGSSLYQLSTAEQVTLPLVDVQPTSLPEPSATSGDTANHSPYLEASRAVFAHRVPRRLPAEMLLDAISQATGSAERFEGQPEGLRATSLPDPTVPSYFLMTFGRPLRNNPCECARSNAPDLAQALHLVNSPAIHAKVSAPRGRLAQRLAAKSPRDALLEELYLVTLSRYPTAQERQIVVELAGTDSPAPEFWEDLLWSLLNSAEFVFQH